ncbi:MAG: hypothetical protein ACXVUL_13865 [Solirubrobacteraceae bacterium]
MARFSLAVAAVLALGSAEDDELELDDPHAVRPSASTKMARHATGTRRPTRVEMSNFMGDS